MVHLFCKTYSKEKTDCNQLDPSNILFKMPKVKSSAKVHSSIIPDQELDVPSSHEESTNSDQESENEGLIPSKQITSTHPSIAKYVHALH